MKNIKLYLAAYMEPEKHGPGKKIAITDKKPDNFSVNGAFPPFTPSRQLSNEYRELQALDQSKAGEHFETRYRDQLTQFVDVLVSDATKDNKDPKELLPFEDGDTLLFWEREGRTSYRKTLSEYLVKLGYSIELR